MEPEGKGFREYREPPRYDEDGLDASSEVKIIDVSNWDEEPQAEDRIEQRGGGTEITSLNELFKKLDEKFGRAEEKLDERFEKSEEARREDKRKAEEARREDINKFERLEEKFDERFGRAEERLDERFEKAERTRKEDMKKFERLEGNLDEKFERIMKDMKERFDTEKDERGKLEEKLEAINGKIEGIGEIVDERVQEVKREVSEKVEVVREQVAIISRDVQEEKIHHGKRIKDLAEEVAGIRRMKAGGTGSPTNFPSPPANLQFHGKPHEHPIAFMRGVENYYSVHAIPPEIRSRFFYQMLDEGAKG
ncbi:tropomyosin alpha-1 chain-like [Ischnura elegans]|uniref:tropomyosin alpha-1 chain-like n=1 Tax=Ischnura elegans TaxID=197161 RepID=UPI001ED88924|nr:tropomyosin alpha-1 chain-like [Ischnura elegans]